jgi:hypothetical protein
MNHHPKDQEKRFEPTSKSVRELFSLATFIPWPCEESESEETVERGLHWGIRKSDFIVYGLAKNEQA